ncbi:MAG: tyrosine-type recombinase/integrase [Acidobacteriota bacterium]
MSHLSCQSAPRREECLELRVKDVDFDRQQIIVRQGKGQKDRATMLPAAARGALTEHLARVRRIPDADLARGFGRVVMPFELDRKCPTAASAQASFVHSWIRARVSVYPCRWVIWRGFRQWPSRVSMPWGARRLPLESPFDSVGYDGLDRIMRRVDTHRLAGQ